MNLDTIYVAKKAKELQEVIVQGQTPPVKQKNDTLEYSASAFKVNPDANADDIIKKMPGITIEQGTVKAGGEDVKKLLLMAGIFLATMQWQRLKTYLPK